MLKSRTNIIPLITWLTSACSYWKIRLFLSLHRCYIAAAQDNIARRFFNLAPPHWFLSQLNSAAKSRQGLLHPFFNKNVAKPEKRRGKRRTNANEIQLLGRSTHLNQNQSSPNYAALQPIPSGHPPQIAHPLNNSPAGDMMFGPDNSMPVYFRSLCLTAFQADLE